MPLVPLIKPKHHYSGPATPICGTISVLYLIVSKSLREVARKKTGRDAPQNDYSEVGRHVFSYSVTQMSFVPFLALS